MESDIKQSIKQNESASIDHDLGYIVYTSALCSGKLRIGPIE